MNFPYSKYRAPKAGDKVRGVHIFGNAYSGSIESCRPHTMDRSGWVIFVKFDKPTDLGVSPSQKTGDVRQGICVECQPPQFKGDTKFQSGAGDWLELL